IEPNGEFLIHESDLAFPGWGSGFQFGRTYSSLSSYFGPLGYGWSHSYERYLLSVKDGTCAGTIEYSDSQGSIRFHRKPNPQSNAPEIYEPDENGLGYRLEHTGAEWILKDGSGLRYVFKDDQNPPRPWRPLVAIRDSLGHEQKIAWSPYDDKSWPD